MHSQGKSKDNHVLQEDKLASKITDSEGKKINTTLLSGFLGRAAAQGRWRLYKAPELQEFIEFNEGDVIHVEKTSDETFAATGSLVWLRRDTEIKHSVCKTRTIVAEFLSGEISAGRNLGNFIGVLPTLHTDVATWLFFATPAFRLACDRQAAAGVPVSTMCAITNNPAICGIINNPPPNSTLCQIP